MQKGEQLKSLQWIGQNLIGDFKVKVVKVDNMLWKTHTISDLQPGTFGLKIETNTTGGLLLINNIPYKHDDDMDEFPMANTNPTWTNNHFHGFWGSANQDNVFACVKPDEKYQYRYSIDPIHPTGLAVCHSHNFSSSIMLEQVSVFPVLVYDSCNNDYPKCKDKYQEEFLFIQVPYLQSCDDSTETISDGCDYKFTNGTSPFVKFIMTNGQLSPMTSYQIDKMIIFRIVWVGNANNLDFAIVDDMNEKVPFRLLSIDSIPIKSGGKPENTDPYIFTNYKVAHIQRFDVGIIFKKPRQYRLVDLNNQGTSTALLPLLYVNAFENVLNNIQQTCIDSGPTLPMIYKNTVSLYDLKLEYNKWVQTVNDNFMNIQNIIAYRSLTFTNHSINNQHFMKENRSEIWEITSTQGNAHSFHIHLMWFLVIAYRDNISDQWTPIPAYWADTLSFTHMSFLIWLFPFANVKQPTHLRAVGKAMVHCHQGFHVDDMMALSMFIGNDPPSGIPNSGSDSLGPRPMPSDVLAIPKAIIKHNRDLEQNDDIIQNNQCRQYRRMCRCHCRNHCRNNC